MLINADVFTSQLNGIGRLCNNLQVNSMLYKLLNECSAWRVQPVSHTHSASQLLQPVVHNDLDRH